MSKIDNSDRTAQTIWTPDKITDKTSLDTTKTRIPKIGIVTRTFRSWSRLCHTKLFTCPTSFIAHQKISYLCKDEIPWISLSLKVYWVRRSLGMRNRTVSWCQWHHTLPYVQVLSSLFFVQIYIYWNSHDITIPDYRIVINHLRRRRLKSDKNLSISSSLPR